MTPRRSARIAASPVYGALARAARRVWTSRARHRATAGLALLAVATVGAVLGVLLAGRTDTDLGPFRAQLAVTPSLYGDSEFDIPPLGKLHLDSHDGPAHLSVRLAQLDQRRTEQVISSPTGVAQASNNALNDLGTGLIRLGLRTLAVATLAGLILGGLMFRDARRTAWSGAIALLVALGGLGSAAATFHQGAIEQPRYEGLLINAPAVVGDARQIARHYDEYASQLQGLVSNVGKLYSTVTQLPVFAAAPGTIRVLHVSDLHLNPSAWPLITTVVKQFDIDVVIDTGDITDWGSEPETSYVDKIGALGVPYVFVRGNHDSSATTAAVARQHHAIVLDDAVTTVAGLRIGGIGDPRFTPDKLTSAVGTSHAGVERLIGSGVQLANTIAAADGPVDIALVHDPATAGALDGIVPLVLAGHIHHREVRMMPALPHQQPTRMLISGSTGGAGLRGLEGAEPTPLSMSVLYFGASRQLAAYDDIQLGGTGRAQVTLERHVVEAPTPAGPAPTPRPSSSATGPR